MHLISTKQRVIPRIPPHSDKSFGSFHTALESYACGNKSQNVSQLCNNQQLYCTYTDDPWSALIAARFGCVWACSKIASSCTEMQSSLRIFVLVLISLFISNWWSTRTLSRDWFQHLPIDRVTVSSFRVKYNKSSVY